MDKFDIGAAATAVVSAKIDFNEAQQRYQAASREHRRAVNRLNDAQKAFDATVEAIRDAAPPGSDWKSRKGEGV